MASGPFVVLNKAKVKLGKGTFNLSTDTVKAALLTNAVAMSNAFVGTSTDARYSDLTSEVTGTGYTTGGLTLNSVTWTDSVTAGTPAFNSNAASWANSVITAKYLVFYDNTTANKDLIGFMDVETSNAIGGSSVGGTFALGPTSPGWFSLT